MPDLLAPTLVVVALGLGASASWGISDFLGGLTSKRAPLLAVMGFTQVIGVAIALPALALRGEPLPVGTDAAYSFGLGFLGIVGLGCLYRGLAVGRMGVVAPVAGILVAGIPVVYGIAIQGSPPAEVLIGIVVAIASVVLIARVPAEGSEGSSGLWWGIAAGATLGTFAAVVSRITPGLVFGPLIIIRSTEAAICVVVILLTRRAWRIPRDLWPAALGIGFFDMTGTAAYLGAVQIGPIAVAAVLSALYPAMTILLATLVLRERLGPLHIVGLVTAAVAVVLIAGGQAG